MMQNLKSWWIAHSAGERAVMAVLGGVILIVLLWLGVWRPVTDGLASGWTKQGLALDRNAAVRARVAALKALPAQAQPDGPPVPIDQLVSQTAAEAGFTLDRGSAQGSGRMAISIGSARMGPLLAWLAQLEAAGIHVQTIGVAPAATDGTVAVQAVLEENQP